MEKLIHIDLGNVGEFATPVTKFVDTLTKATGIAPLGTFLQAKADAAAKLIQTKAEITSNLLLERAQTRIEYREKQRQQNIENISILAVQELPASVSSKPVEQEWILRFFDYAQDVCDADMQSLWARILAGEVASPGSYSKRTLQFLTTIEKEDAIKFVEICAFACTDKDDWHYIVQNNQTIDEIRNKISGGDFLSHLQSIGLMLPGFQSCTVSSLEDISLGYFGKRYLFSCSPQPTGNKQFPLLEMYFTMLPFSQIGQQLAQIARPQPINGYVERLSKSLNAELKVSLSELE